MWAVSIEDGADHRLGQLPAVGPVVDLRPLREPPQPVADLRWPAHQFGHCEPSDQPYHRSGYGYDANGNMTGDGLNTLTYDGENRAVTSAGGGTMSTYTYDGNSLRVKKQVGSG